jgi:hypothetical protein
MVCVYAALSNYANPGTAKVADARGRLAGLRVP